MPCQQVLLKLDFDSKWVALVMSCLTFVTYKVLLNEIPTSSFAGFRGLWQGDSLSPYLFVLCIEVLSTLLQHANLMG